MIIKFENFTYGDLEKYEKDDLDEELMNYSNWYEFWEDEDDEIKKIVDNTINEFKNKLPIFDSIHVQLIKNFKNDNDGILGMYSHQSVLRTPIIFLGIKNIYDVLKEDYNVSLETTIRTTIFHELGHAIVDVDNLFVYIEDQNILNFDDEEEYVEDFAFNLEMFGKISDPNILKLSELYKNKEPIEINDY